LIWRSIEATETGERQRQLLSELMDRPITLHPEARPERLGLRRAEHLFVKALKESPRTLGALLQSGLIDAAAARRLVYALALTRQLDLGDGATPLATRRKPPSCPRAATNATPRSRERSPGRLVAPTPRVQRALQRVTRGSRPAPSNGRQPETAEKLLAAARAAERRDRLDEAEALCREACDADPNSPECAGLHAWIRVRRGALSDPRRTETVLSALNRAALKRQDSVELRLYRARTLWRLGRHAEASRDFAFVAQRDPENLEAVRHLRLERMRAGKREASRGLLSRLFSR
jgi:tetratricopeptide (TPR) repeat protein